ncbi:hypothetical protein M1D68_00920 [Pseudomonas sp. R4-84]
MNSLVIGWKKITVNAGPDDNRVAGAGAGAARQVFYRAGQPLHGFFAQGYFSIEQYRLGNRLQWTVGLCFFILDASDAPLKGGAHIGQIES